MMSQVLGCIVAALVVALVWEHHRLSAVERKLDRMGKPWNDRKRR